MLDDRVSAISRTQRDRLAFIEMRLRFIGNVRRQDLIDRFGIQSAAATRDIAQYKAIAAGNLEYDGKGKVYIRAERFHPIFDFPAGRILTWLSQGYGDAGPQLFRSIVATEGVNVPIRIKLELLSTLTRAIHLGVAVQIAYHALSSGLTTREIVPFALANDGLRWHLRAFDRRSGEFRDLVLGRFDGASILPGAVADHEMPAQDIQWNRITELELVPHPANVQHPDTIEAEYGMEGGVLNVRTRAAMAGYLLRRWNVDCTNDHRLKGSEYHLWLRNRQALYGVTNLVIAPGYEEGSKER